MSKPDLTLAQLLKYAEEHGQNEFNLNDGDT